jgi:hypothetical protein
MGCCVSLSVNCAGLRCWSSDRLHAITSGDQLVTSTGYENGITSNSDFAE